MKILVIILSLIIISCTKSAGNESQNVIDRKDDSFTDTANKKPQKYEMDFYKVILYNKNVIYKENSLDKNRIEIDNNVIYDIIFVNATNNTNTTIVSDKFFNLKVLPVFYNQTRENQMGGNDIIETTQWECFVLQIFKNNNYKLIYIDDSNNDMKIREYEYKNLYYPSYITIIITPNYFIVCHDDMDGEECILINQDTGEYEVIDTQEKEGH
ncbi:MAG: hypothetical protein LBV17_02080 [Treponema sp.]|jgi:hypothetical protein|nr:hypothetical protein [Treponema sp.]